MCLLADISIGLMSLKQLVIDKSLATLPRRKTDNAIIIRSKESAAGKTRVFKLNAVAEEPILLERYALKPPNGYCPLHRSLHLTNNQAGRA